MDMATTFGLLTGYRQRVRPEYFADDANDGVTWQPDVYPYAVDLGKRRGRSTIIDIGCGRAGKLVTIAPTEPGWRFVGVDFGPNIAWCGQHHTFGEWIEADLESCTSGRKIDPEWANRRRLLTARERLRPAALSKMWTQLLTHDPTGQILAACPRQTLGPALGDRPRRGNHHERFEITRNGRPAAVLLGADDYEAMRETIAVLADSELVPAIREGLAGLTAKERAGGGQRASTQAAWRRA